MDDKTKVTFLIKDALSSKKDYLNKKYMDKMDKLTETEKSVLKLIKNNNEVVS